MRGRRLTRPRPLALDDDLVALDEAVREHAVGGLAADALRLRGVVDVELDVEHATRPHRARRVAERRERLANGLALRIEDALLGPDEHRHLHARTPISSR